jgi:hypothetical protein
VRRGRRWCVCEGGGARETTLTPRRSVPLPRPLHPNIQPLACSRWTVLVLAKTVADNASCAPLEACRGGGAGALERSDYRTTDPMGLEHLLNGCQPARLLQTGTPPQERCSCGGRCHSVEVLMRRKGGDGEGVCSRPHVAPFPPRSARRHSCASSRCDTSVWQQCFPHPHADTQVVQSVTR